MFQVKSVKLGLDNNVAFWFSNKHVDLCMFLNVCNQIKSEQ